MLPSPRIYLCGPAGCGKSTVARLLQRDHDFRRVSLGELCRRECGRRGWSEDREHLQAAGDLIRRRDPAGVVLAAGIVRLRGPLVVDGVRLVAEAAYLRAHGLTGVAVRAPGPVRAARLLAREGTPLVPDHLTERQAGEAPADLWFINAGEDLEALGTAVRLLVARLALRQAEHARQSLARGRGRS